MKVRVGLAWAICLVIAALCAAQPDKESTPNPESGPIVFGPLPGLTCVNSGGDNCTGVIPDGAPGTTSGSMSASFDVSDCAVIEDVNLGVELTHTFIGDLAITVEGPSTTQAEVFLVDDCEGEDDLWVVYDDEAGGPLGSTSPCSPHVAGESYTPNPGPLSVFDGESAQGTWTLTIVDNFSNDSGQLTDWSLELTCQAAPVPTMPSPWQAILAAVLVLSGLAVLARRRAAG